MAISIERSFRPTERYEFDFGPCSARNGWAQMDTEQDAHYFGVWTNPYTREIRTYCEGDHSLQRADTEEEYKAMLLEAIDFYISRGYWKGIDPGTCGALAAEFERMGLGEFLH